jgi:hypothetical protein
MPDIRTRGSAGSVPTSSASSSQSSTTNDGRDVHNTNAQTLPPVPSAQPSSLLLGGRNGVQRTPAALVRFDRNQPDAERWRTQLQGILGGGDAATLPLGDVVALQTMALEVAQRLFTNEFNDDSDIKHHVGLKQARYGASATNHLPGVQDAVFRGNLRDRQCDALLVLLHTFRGVDEADTELRRAVLQKLAKIGRASDLDFVLPLCRKSPHSSDLHHALEAAKAIGKRHPPKRGGLHGDPIIGPLLRKPGLTDDERRTVVEAVLTRGEVKSARRHNGGNMNEVHFLTFKETMKDRHGHDVAIRAVYKPERTWPGKDKCFYAREVAAYEFDRAFAKTGMVPPTAEVLLEIDGNVGLGSLQFMIPNARPLGADLSGMSVDEARKHAGDLHPDFRDFVHSDDYKRQESKLRTLLFVLGDPDKLANDVHPKANLQNIMVDANRRLWMIDNAYSMGAPPRDPGDELLPNRIESSVVDTLHNIDPREVTTALEPLVGSKAKDVARRVDIAEHDLERKPRI